jgi:hypothetical protein
MSNAAEEMGMDRFFEDQLWKLWQNLETVWSRMKAVVSDHVWLAAAFVGIVVLFWFFLSPGIKDK